MDNLTIASTSELFVSSSSPIFLGHFPGNPIFPAFRQLEWVRHSVENLLGQHSVRGFSQVKFLRPIIPDQTLYLELDQKLNEIEFTINVAGDVTTKGHVTLSPTVQ